MAKVTVSTPPPVPPKTYTLELTEREAKVVYLLVNYIGGVEETDDIFNAFIGFDDFKTYDNDFPFKYVAADVSHAARITENKKGN